jgi:(S)-2-hydroxyglutarate dehydrogenase
MPEGELYDFCVVGGGIVGVSVARHLLGQRPGAKLVLLEKESAVAVHQTGHNSGVIHSGIYYRPGSLKARLCREGGARLRELCASHGIPIVNCGKLIVATNEVEVTRLRALVDRAALNEVAAEMIDGAEITRREPNVRGLAAAVVPSSSIVDYTRVTEALADEVRALGGRVMPASGVSAIEERPGHVEVRAGDVSLRTRRLVVCGGLQADRLARMAGLPVDFRVVPFRGEYFRLAARHDDIVQHLIYPVPDPGLPFLGVHITRTVDGGVTLGPNAVLGLAREGYRKGSFAWRDAVDTATFPGMWRFAVRYAGAGAAELSNSWFKSRYLRQARKYCPVLTVADLRPEPAGIRAQVLTKAGRLVDDFMYVRTDRMLHMINAPSPAATASLPIGAHIATLCLESGS